jgi:hypothetical protein
MTDPMSVGATRTFRRTQSHGTHISEITIAERLETASSKLRDVAVLVTSLCVGTLFVAC